MRAEEINKQGPIKRDNDWEENEDDEERKVDERANLLRMNYNPLIRKIFKLYSTIFINLFF